MRQDGTFLSRNIESCGLGEKVARTKLTDITFWGAIVYSEWAMEFYQGRRSQRHLQGQILRAVTSKCPPWTDKI